MATDSTNRTSRTGTTGTSGGRNARQQARTNAIIMLLAVVGIVVLVNVINTGVFGRVDLTQNAVHTLSDASKAAVQRLEDLEVRVYVSADLPTEVDVGYGQKVQPRQAAQAFLDKLEEYRSYSDGNMTLLRVRDDVETKAENAKLRLFSAEEARVSSGGLLEFQRYALGATFSYKNVTEVLPLALQPDRLEFEVTKILLRLQEKAAQSRLMIDVLATGRELFESVETCNKAVTKAIERDPEGGSEGGLALTSDPLQKALAKLTAELPEIRKVCEPLPGKLAAAREQMGVTAAASAANTDLQRVFDSVAQFLEFFAQMGAALSAEGGEPQAAQQALQIAGLLGQLFQGIDRDYQLLVDSPGRKTIGFLCGHQEFCPFAADEPLIRPELAQVFGQQNPFVQRFLGQVQQLEQEVDQLNESIRRGLFTMRGFDIRKVEAEETVPADIDALVVFGPRKPLSVRTQYELDQFLLSGRPVVVFANRFDVALRNFDVEGNLTVTNLTTTESNLAEWLAKYGVELRKDLVLEPERNAPIVLTELVRQGQLVWQSQKAFPYPLLPTFTDLNDKHPLVSGISNLTLPWVSSVDGAQAAEKGLDVTWLIRSSAKAVARGGDLPLLPPQLLAAMQAWEPGGPYTVALIAAGDFPSAFQGQAIPAATGEKPADGEDAEAARKKAEAEALAQKQRRDAGAGRLLVLGSNLGLENLSAGRIFEGFDLAGLTSGGFEFIEKSRDYAARYQNWRWRIQQLGDTLEDSVLVLQNTLDWAVQNEALLAIRSKGYLQRPLDQISEGQRSALRYAGILTAPVLFVLFGIVRWQVRRRRRPVL
jgi:ABC-type uncharacterized transport system involved in gliding motility auxiliary subunit